MPSFGKVSEERLSTAHPALQKLARHIVREFDISIIECWRSPEKQLEYYETGRSKVMLGKHNHCCVIDGVRKPWSLAMDIAPYPIDFGRTPKQVLKSYVDKHMTASSIVLLERELLKASRATAQFYYLAGLVRKHADILNIKIRWGGDWDSDQDFFDQTFYDLVHFELVGYEDRPFDDGVYGYAAN